MSKTQPNITEPSNLDTPIVRVRRFLDILRYKTTDMNKYKKEMDMSKMEIKMLLDKYKSSQHTVTIHSQQLLVNINDHYLEFKDLEDKYLKTKRNVENIQRMIENINIRPYIHNVVEEFQFEL